MKKKEIIDEHEKRHKITQGSGKDTRWRTRLPDGSGKDGKGRQVKAATLEELERQIVDFYLEQEDESITIRNLYPKYLERKSMEKLADSSIARYKNTWDKYLEPDTTLVDADISTIKSGQFKNWVLKLLNAHPMKRKGYNDIRIVLNGIIDYAVEMDYIQYNRFKDIKISKNCFLPNKENPEEQVFTQEEIQLIDTWLWEKYNSKPTYTVPLALLFAFQTGLRAGELEAIRFSDVDAKGYLHVQREQVKVNGPDGKLSEFQIVEHTKTDSRRMPVYLTQKARHILKLARKANFKNGDVEIDYVFYNRHKPLSTAALNRCLNTACEKSGIPVRTSHKVRKTLATVLSNSGVDETIVTSMMGHASIETTKRYYIKDNHTKDETAEEVEAALQKVVPPCTTF